MVALRQQEAKADRLAALKEARAKGGRLQQWKPQDAEIYDEVTSDQYKSILGSRGGQDDFIVDDDGQGNGYLDDDSEEEEQEREESSEDEDDFEGEDEELRKARKLKRRKLRAKQLKAAGTKAEPRAKPKAAMSDYARPAKPAASTGQYRPAHSVVQEDDFMASLLSSVTATTAETARKRRSSPDFPSSSDPVGPSSDGSFFASRKRYGQESDDEAPPPRRAVYSKKPRVSEATVVPDENTFGGDYDMDLDDVHVKEERLSDGEDLDMAVKPRAALTSAATKLNQPRRQVVNSTSVKHVKAESIPSTPTPASGLLKAEPPSPISAVRKPRPTPGPSGNANGAKHWSTVQESLDPKVKELDEVKAPVGNVKSENVLEPDGSLKLFWLDQMEMDGVVHMVGKVLDRATNRYVSACLSINGIERNLFVKPRAKRVHNGIESDIEVTKTDVYEEFDKVRQKAGIEEFAGKFVQRKYAFEEAGVEKGESEWLKVVYGFNQPELPLDTSGSTFSHVFGTNTSPFELLVVKRKIMGPCWLQVKNASVNEKSMSWCKVEFSVKEPKDVNPYSENDASAPKDTPPLTMMSISLRTIVNHKANKTEVLCATTRTWEGCNIEDPTPPDRLPSSLNTIVRPIEKFPANLETRAKSERPPFQTVKAERALLNSLLATIQRHDPDVIVSHNFLGNSFEALLYRMRELKADHWSRIGRFRRKAMNISKAGSNVRLMAGRLVADLSSDAAKGMISSTTWSLTEMCNTHLRIQREDIDPEDTHAYFDHTLQTPDKLIKFIRLCEVDAYFQMAIASRVQMLPLTKQLTNLAGNSWNLTLNGGRAVRNEFILLHEFHRLKYVCPDKSFKNFKQKSLPEGNEDDEDGPSVSTVHKRGKAKYAGGLVFEPKRGLWDTYILVMDFNSLYPSIIQEYNIDFTTVERNESDEIEEDKIPDIPPSDVAQGVLPRIIATLVNRRRAVKGLMKDKSAPAARMMQWDIKQQALKLTANSMYGCLGFAGSRFSSRPLAALTTFKGREILTHTRELAESLQLDVVYGDTDSVFVNSNVTSYPEAVKIANELKKAVNERYKLLEIDLDAVFERILLLNKKKYAAVKIDEAGEKVTEVKGLDMKRREFSKVSKDSSSAVLREILSGAATEDVVSKIHELLTSIGENVRSGAVPLDDFIIFKRLGKNPEDYPDKKSQPHVQVALRMKTKGVAVRAHDVIPYTICLGADGTSARSAQADRAFHPDDLRRQGSELKIDYEYYLDNQVLQPIHRLCEDIEGTEKPRLAECLGLDPARYIASIHQDSEKQFHTFESQITDKERFKDSEAFNVRCMGCEGSFVFDGLSENQANTVQAIGVVCPACQAVVPPPSISVQLENAIRAHVSRYYLGWTQCDGEGCGARTRMMSVYGRRCLGFEKEGCRGTVKLEYSDSMLYNQLLYYLSLFDTEKAMSAARGTQRFDEVRALAQANSRGFAEVAGMVEKYLERNGRRYVDMSGLFGFMEKIRI